MRVLVSAGPTREMIDEVRFLSNLSSGRTGYAVADAARDAGHDVVLVSGPVALSPPKDIKAVAVTSALEMRDALLEAYRAADVVVMTAAVCDYRPRERTAGKRKKAPGGWSLELVRNPDILAEMGADKGERVLVGFALEVQDAETNAMRKREAKNLDMIVLNGPENFGGDASEFRIVTADGIEPVRRLSKAELGRLLLSRAEAIRAAAGGTP